MAEEAKEEEIIIIEDNDAIEDTQEEKQTSQKTSEDEEGKQKKIILFGGIAIIVVLLIVMGTLLYIKYKKTHKPIDLTFIDKKLQQPTQEPIKPSKLENMIAKANYLYETGSKQKALTLYEQIAHYSQAISLYNLGVAQLKDKQYKTAQQTFQQAIQNDEKRCVSAINAAVCSLHLNEKENFHYYLDLAYAYLPYEINSPLYSYYYTLINYYNKNYFAALSSLKNSNTQAYPRVQNHLKARIDAMYDNNYDAIDALEKSFDAPDELSLGLLYARVGNLDLAKSHLQGAITKGVKPLRAELALSYINIKTGDLKLAASHIKSVLNSNNKEIYDYYPIKVKLKDSLFDPQAAQKEYRKRILFTKNTLYQKFFYFSPYKAFNANQTISYIRKGNANIYIDDVKSAQGYLRQGSSASNVNLGITKAIQDALNFKLRLANQKLLQLVKIQPKHSILQYNLALTYAQLGDMKKANEHFTRSYYLDAKNYLSGVYAVLTAQLIHKPYKKLKSILKDSLYLEKDGEEKNLYLTLLALSENNYMTAIEWLDHNYKQRPLYLMLDIAIATKLKEYKKAKEASEKLLAMQSEDILPNLIYIDTHFYNYSVSKYAKEVLSYLKKKHFHYKDLYYGAYITRYLFIQEKLITGQLYPLRQQLQRRLSTTTRNTQELESSLALASLYDKAFEESYTLYNHLIDDLKVRDAYTLYLGAVASTAAKHHGNAIALLELSKMKNKSFYESRFALALLYMEINNFEGATIQFERIEEDGFISNYFEFEIDTQKMLFKKQHPND